jgi:uncharacterized protein
MGRDLLRYDKMVEDALRGIVRQSLAQVAKSGFPANHHFYLTFRTCHSGVAMPDYLRAQYPEEMTIVLQYQFKDLEVGTEGFEVTLSFNKMLERLHIPFAALTEFVDPAVQFRLEFKGEIIAGEPSKPGVDAARAGETQSRTTDKVGQIVALDAFRKK